MIKPSVGRVVLFYPHADEGEPEGTTYAALIAKVLDDRLINLAIFNSSGAPFSRQAVLLLQDDDVAPATGHYAAWMDYQKGQVAKTDAVLAAVASAAAPAPAVVDLQPVHDRINALGADLATIEKVLETDGPIHGLLKDLETGVDGKFTELGTWLQKRLAEIDARLPAPTDPAPPVNDAAPAATEQPAAPAPDPATAGQTAAAAAGTAPQPA